VTKRAFAFLLVLAALLAPAALPAPDAPYEIKGSEVIVHGFKSLKLVSYAFAEWLTLRPEKRLKNVEKNLGKGSSCGLLLVTRLTSLSPTFNSSLYRFVLSGGRVGLSVFAGADIPLARANIESLKLLFEIDVAAEMVAKPNMSQKGEDFTPLWKDLKVGYEKCRFEYDMFLVPQRGVFEEGGFKSETSGFMRCLSAHRKLGAGEILVMAVPYNTIFEDEFIDQYDNRKASMLLARWLAGKKQYK
jgi:hypothetical protein